MSHNPDDREVANDGWSPRGHGRGSGNKGLQKFNTQIGQDLDIRAVKRLVLGGIWEPLHAGLRFHMGDASSG